MVVPVTTMYEIVKIMEERLIKFEHAKVYAFGHLGDDNLHLNVSHKGDPNKEILKAIEPYLYEWYFPYFEYFYILGFAIIMDP